jgi:hypothetical protein
MAVARDHTLWIGGDKGELYRSDWSTCSNTGFKPANFYNSYEGSGIAVDLDGKEYLYATPVRTDGASGSPVENVVVVDLEAVEVSATLPIEYGIGLMELAGSGDSRLFGVTVDFGTERKVTLMQVDPSNARFLWQSDVSEIANPFFCTIGCDIAFWSGSLYIFNSDLDNRTTSDVWRYNLESQALSKVGSLPFVVIGADSTTCAPL